MARELLGNVRGPQGPQGVPGQDGVDGLPGEVTLAQLEETESVLKESITNISITPKDFGAMGDGVTDDTVALETFLNDDQPNKFIPYGNYLVTRSIDIVNSGFNLKSDGVIVGSPTTLDRECVMITGDNNIINVNVDGKNGFEIGLKVIGKNNIIERCIIENCYGDEYTAVGISLSPTGGNKIINNTVRNIFGLSNNTIGDALGSARGIYVSYTVSSDELITIDNNTIENIIGEEGEGIHLISNSSITLKTVISNNTITDFTRRGIKLQHSDVVVVGNTLKEVGMIDISNSNRAIDIIGRGSINVINNIIDVTNFNGIGVTGTTSNVLNGINILNNVINVNSAINIIYTTHTNKMCILNNVLEGGTNVLVSTSDMVDISNNTIKNKFDILDTATTIYIYANNTNCKTTNNVMYESASNTFVTNSSVGGISEQNNVLKVVV